MTLAEQLEAAKQREQIQKWDAGESRLAAGLKLSVPKPAVAKDVLERLDIFGKWAASKSVRKCPAKPWTVAAFVREQHALGATTQVILAMLAAVEALHDFHGLSNPVHTAIVRAALDQIIKIDPPRGWSLSERVEFASLPPDVRDIIATKERLRDKAVRRAQNEAAKAKRLSNGADETVHVQKETTNDHQETVR